MRDRTSAPELYELSRVVPAKFVQKAPVHGSYVPHYVIVQWLLATVGPFDWELVEVLRGDSAGTVKQVDIDVRDVIVGCVYRLTCTIDGRSVRVEEVGEVDAYTKTGDGARLKHAASDALKRCAMRLGVAIQLWCKTTDDHFLPQTLNKENRDPAVDTGEVVVVGGEDQDEPDMTHATVTDADPQYTLPTDAYTKTKQLPPFVDKMPSITPPKSPPGTWNQLLATLENLPAVTDTKPVWLKYAKQLTGLMVLAGLWHETEGDKLTELSKKALVEKVTVAHKAAVKIAGERKPF